MSDGTASQVTELLETIRGGDAGAVDRLLPLVYDELRGLAAAIFRGNAAQHTLQPTALVHEAWMKMAGGVDRLNDREHFFAVAARAMRHVLADHARARGREKRGGGGRHQVTLDGNDAAMPASNVDLIELHEALEELADLDARQSRIAELRLFGGLTVREAAKILGVSRTTVSDEWRAVQAWLTARLTPP